MAQAEPSRTTSRRGFLASAVLAVAFAPTIATAIELPHGETADWKAFETGLVWLASLVDDIDDDIWRSGKIVAEWERRNPFPDDHWSTPEELTAVSIRERTWTARYESVVRKCGRGSFTRHRNLAYARYSELLQRVANTPALNCADTQAKARLVRFEPSDGPIRKSLLRDLLKL